MCPWDTDDAPSYINMKHYKALRINFITFGKSKLKLENRNEKFRKRPHKNYPRVMISYIRR